MSLKKSSFVEVANAEISSKRKAVISRLEDKSYTIGQQIQAADNGKVISVFLKGAIHVADIDGLINLRDALNVAIKKEQK